MLKLLSDVCKRKVARWQGGYQTSIKRFPYYFLHCKCLQVVCRNKSERFTLNPFLCYFCILFLKYIYSLLEAQKNLRSNHIQLWIDFYWKFNLCYLNRDHLHCASLAFSSSPSAKRVRVKIGKTIWKSKYCIFGQI